MAEEAPPVAIDLVTSRKGVFSGVLQETLLATYRKTGRPIRRAYTSCRCRDETALEVSLAGSFRCPSCDRSLADSQDGHQAELITAFATAAIACQTTATRSRHGPLVWNRHKPQLHVNPVAGSYPILWAECVTSDGRFQHRTEKKNHKPYLKPEEGSGVAY